MTNADIVIAVLAVLSCIAAFVWTARAICSLAWVRNVVNGREAMAPEVRMTNADTFVSLDELVERYGLKPLSPEARDRNVDAEAKRMSRRGP